MLRGLFYYGDCMNVNTYPPELAYVFGKLAIAMNSKGQKIYKRDARFICTVLEKTDIYRYKEVAAQVSRLHT
jgi:hypothetical protein